MTPYALRIEPRAMAPRQVTHDDPRPAFAIQQILRRRLGLESFVPAKVETRIRQPERQRARTALFHRRVEDRFRTALLPGFCFVYLDNPNWLRILSISSAIRGVFGIGEPYAFRPSEMARLHAISDELQSPEFYQPKPFRAGDEVDVETPLFTGRVRLIGYDSAHERGRFEALVFGQVREIEVEGARIRRAG